MIPCTPPRSFASALWRAGLAVALTLAATTSLSAASSSQDQVSVVASTASVSEAGGGTAHFTIHRSGSTGPLTVLYVVTGSATPGPVAGGGNDYLTLSGTATFPSADPLRPDDVDVVVQPFDDALPEGSESVVLTLVKDAAPFTYTIGTPSVALITILDDELTASMETPIAVCYEPGVAPPGTPLDPFSAAVFRASFTATTFNRNLQVQFTGSATPGVDYSLQIVYGHDIPAGSGAGILLDAGRRSLNGVVTGGTPIGSTGTSGYAKGTTTAAIIVGNSRNGVGQIENGDVVTFSGVTGTYQVSAVAPAGPAPLVTSTRSFTVFPPLAGDLLNGAEIQTSIPIDLTGNNRLTINLPAGYRQIEYEIYPLTDTTAEGGETVVCSLVQSPDYSTLDPTVGTVTIGDDNVTASINLISNAIEGSTNGIARVTLSGSFPVAVQVPFTVAGSATPGVDYTIAGLDNATLSGSVTIPAGATTIDIPIVAISDALTETIETVVITMQTSFDFVNVSSPGSTTGPSVTVNIADSGVPIATTPTTPSGTTGATTTPTAPVRTLPTSSSSKGCGLGSGTAILIAFAVAFLTRMRLASSARRQA